MAQHYSADACQAIDDAGQPYPLLLEPHQLMTAQIEFRKVEDEALKLGDLAVELTSVEPFSNCPACADVPGDRLEDGGWIRGGSVGGDRRGAIRGNVCK